MKSDLRRVLEKAWRQAGQNEKATYDAEFLQKRLEELEAEFGARTVADWRRIVVDDGTEYTLSVEDAYREMRGKAAFRYADIQWKNSKSGKKKRRGRVAEPLKPQLAELRQNLQRADAVKELAKKYNLTTARINQILREES